MRARPSGRSARSRETCWSPAPGRPTGSGRTSSRASRAADGRSASGSGSRGAGSRHQLAAANWQFLLYLFFIVSIADGIESMKRELGASFEYWGSLAMGVLAGAGVLMAVSLLLRWGWRVGLALGLSVSLALNTFAELKTAVVPALGGPGALAVGGATALVVAWIAWALLARC